MSKATETHDQIGEAIKRLRAVDAARSQLSPNVEEELSEILQGIGWQLQDVIELLRRARANASMASDQIHELREHLREEAGLGGDGDE